MFKRERRYLVMKGSDMAEVLTEDEQNRLVHQSRMLDAWRERNGKIPLDVFVLERDWPEFDIAVDMVRRRMEGLPTREAELIDKIREYKAAFNIANEALANANKRASKVSVVNGDGSETDGILVQNSTTGTVEALLSSRQPGMQTMLDLSMLVKQLCRAILNHPTRVTEHGKTLADKAMDYLQRKGLQGSPLRVEGEKACLHTGQIDGLVDKFLRWPLPESVCSDPCASMHGYPNRVGTNLLTATEAKQMIEYLLSDSNPWVTEWTARVPRYALVAKADGAYTREAADGEYVKWSDHLARLQGLLKAHGDAALQEIDRLLEAEKSRKEMDKAAIIEAIREALGSAYDCTRVWSAWGCNTMGPDDFSLVAEDDDRVEEIADAVLKAAVSPAPAPDKEALKKVAVEFFYWWHNQPGSNTEEGFDQWWASRG